MNNLYDYDKYELIIIDIIINIYYFNIFAIIFLESIYFTFK